MFPRYFHSCMEAVSQPLLPPPPPWCSSISLYPLIVSTNVFADCPSLVWVNPPLVSHHPPLHLQGQVEEEGLNICPWRRPGKPTDGRQQQRERARASGMEFWRERQTKDEEGTKTAGCRGCMQGLKKGRMKEEEVYRVK